MHALCRWGSVKPNQTRILKYCLSSFESKYEYYSSKLKPNLLRILTTSGATRDQKDLRLDRDSERLKLFRTWRDQNEKLGSVRVGPFRDSGLETGVHILYMVRLIFCNKKIFKWIILCKFLKKLIGPQLYASISYFLFLYEYGMIQGTLDFEKTLDLKKLAQISQNTQLRISEI